MLMTHRLQVLIVKIRILHHPVRSLRYCRRTSTRRLTNLSRMSNPSFNLLLENLVRHSHHLGMFNSAEPPKLLNNQIISGSGPKDLPLVNIVQSLLVLLSTRKQLASDALWCFSIMNTVQKWMSKLLFALNGDLQKMSLSVSLMDLKTSIIRLTFIVEEGSFWAKAAPRAWTTSLLKVQRHSLLTKQNMLSDTLKKIGMDLYDLSITQWWDRLKLDEDIWDYADGIMRDVKIQEEVTSISAQFLGDRWLGSIKEAKKHWHIYNRG
ncbi:hypothetical protein Tco_0588296 [Tanacetum coccineum]